MTHRPPSRRRGQVRSFDEEAGHGVVASDDGEWFFHCTAIADGSRSIEVGVEVDFALVPGHRGRREATELRRA